MIAWALETLLATSVLMLVVLAIRIPVARWFGPHIAYALWALPALRLLLPPLPEQVAPAPLHLLPSPIDLELLLAAPLPAAASVEPAMNWPLLAGVLWVAGAALFLAWHVFSYRRFVDAALGQATQLPRFDRDGVEVCASPLARGPFAAGIFLKSIVLPEDYRRRYDRDELRLAIEHEVQHHRRWDMSANFAALAVLALHWWNPIAYFAHRAFRVDQELACDALVLAGASPADRHAYGSALLKSACDRLPVAACALGAGDDLKRRLTMMKTYRWNPARARAGGAMAALLVGGGLMLTASNGIAAETTKSMEREVRTALAPVIAPEPPAAPAAPPAPRPLAAPLPPAAPPAPRVPDVPDVPEIDTAWADHAAATAADAVDHARIAQEVAADMQRELPRIHAEIRQAQTHNRQAQAELRRELPRIQAEMRRAHAEMGRAHAAAGSCGGQTMQVRMSSDEGGSRMVTCTIDSDQIRRTMIVSLQRARQAIVAMDAQVMAATARDQALEAVDRRLAELRAER